MRIAWVSGGTSRSRGFRIAERVVASGLESRDSREFMVAVGVMLSGQSLRSHREQIE